MEGKFNNLFADAMRLLDIEVVFGVMGDANMFIADSFSRLTGTRFVSTANESGGVLAAAGYAAVTDRVGVATVTHGAIANCVSALFDATRGGHPVLVIAGDTSRAQGLHLQNIPQREVVAPTGAEYRQVRTAETAGLDLQAALRSALSHRRPVVLEIPSDMQQVTCAMQMPAAGAAVHAGTTVPSRETLEEAAAAILGSNRPLVLAGRGTRRAEASVAALAERIGAPVATTMRGKGLFRHDRYNVGIFGTLSNPVGSDVIAQSDCILAFGASLSALTTLKGELLSGKKVVQIDDDPRALGRYDTPDLGIVGDAGATAVALIELLDEAEAEASGFRSERLADRLAEFHQEDRSSALATGPLTLTGVLHRMNDLVDASRTLTIDGGRFCHEAMRIITVEDPRDYAHCLNVGHIGLSVGHGIGAALGQPGKTALVIAGDGGFMLGGLTEFNTAVRHRADMVVVLINDNAYGAEYYRFVGQDLDPAPTTFDWPSFAEVAKALGGRGVRVAQWSDLDELGEHLAQPGPLLVEVLLDPASIPNPGEH